jgi:hypothetical protein
VCCQKMIGTASLLDPDIEVVFTFQSHKDLCCVKKMGTVFALNNRVVVTN